MKGFIKLLQERLDYINSLESSEENKTRADEIKICLVGAMDYFLKNDL